MRIVCPGCSATYDVPEALLGRAARMVRCARCSAEWTATAAPLATEAPMPGDEPDIDFYRNEPQADAQADAADEDADMSGRTEPRLTGLRPRPNARPSALPPPEPEPARKGGALAIAAWAASVLILAGAGGAAVQYRSQLIAAWPPSERVFAAIGLR